jgi:hypothetical protein
MRGRHGNIFGGYLMREAFELAWLSALCFFDGHTPRFKVPPSPFSFCHCPPSVASHVVPLPVSAPAMGSSATTSSSCTRCPWAPCWSSTRTSCTRTTPTSSSRCPHPSLGLGIARVSHCPCVKVEAFKLNPNTQYRMKTNELIYVFRAPDTLSKVLHAVCRSHPPCSAICLSSPSR